MLVLIDGFCQLHILVHENDGGDLPGYVCLVAICLVEAQAGMEAHLTYVSSLSFHYTKRCHQTSLKYVMGPDDWQKPELTALPMEGQNKSTGGFAASV